MSIYTPSTFSARDETAIARLVRDHPFATLITPGNPEPFISHLPLELASDRGPQHDSMRCYVMTRTTVVKTTVKMGRKW